MPTKGIGNGKNVDKDRCAECGSVVVLVDGRVHRWDKWWDAGDWIHQDRPEDQHNAFPMRDIST